MNPIDRIIKLFFDRFDVQLIEEDDESLSYKVQSTALKIPAKDILMDSFVKIPGRDKLVLMVIVDEGDPYSHNIQNDDDLEKFLSELSDARDLFDEDTIIDIKIEVSKGNKNNSLTIYFFDSIVQSWMNYSIKSFWFCFGRILVNKFINFEVMEDIRPFHSANISFSTVGSEYRHRIDKFSCTPRKDLNNKMIDNCHFAHSAKCRLIPDDFYLLEQSENKTLNELFKRFTLIQSIVYLFDITAREKDRVLYYKVIGYRQISGTLKLEEFEPNVADEYFRIYNWVYGGGNLSDKIGLARNILSIHIRKNNPILLTDEVLSSVKSGYDIYLKQNISQYIATKKQVVESLQEISSRANQIVESITVPFRNSFLAIITFFVSMSIIRISLTQSLDHIFTNELAIISFFIIGLSLFYLWLLNREIDIDKVRFGKNYENLKSRYEDILDEQDIKKIFNHDRDYNDNVRYIDDKKCRYTKGWIFIHALLVILIVLLMVIGDEGDKKRKPKQPVPTTQSQDPIRKLIEPAAQRPEISNKNDLKDTQKTTIDKTDKKPVNQVGLDHNAAQPNSQAKQPKSEASPAPEVSNKKETKPSGTPKEVLKTTTTEKSVTNSSDEVTPVEKTQPILK